MSCKHQGHLINQGLWWCNLKDENGNQIHPECKCDDCQDKEELTIVSFSTSQSQ